MSKLSLSRIVLVGAIVMAGCGSGDPVPNPQITVTPTPNPTATVAPGSAPYALEKFAKISASSFLDSQHMPIQIADDLLGKGSGLDYQVWEPSTGVPPNSPPNNSSIDLTWNSQVQVKEIHLYDLQTVGQVTAGFILFSVKSGATAIPRLDFGSLPDNGLTPLKLNGPSSPITGMSIHITSSKPESASRYGVGIAEVAVLGTRVDEAIASGDVAQFGRVPTLADHGYSSSLGAMPTPAVDVGPYQARNIRDGRSDTMWVTNGNGGSAFIVMEFDRTYSITQLVLQDLGVGQATRFTSGKVLLDGGKSFDFSKGAGSANVTVDLPESVASKKIEIQLSAVSGGSNTGLSEVQITGSYTPASQ